MADKMEQKWWHASSKPRSSVALCVCTFFLLPLCEQAQASMLYDEKHIISTPSWQPVSCQHGREAIQSQPGPSLSLDHWHMSQPSWEQTGQGQFSRKSQLTCWSMSNNKSLLSLVTRFWRGLLCSNSQLLQPIHTCPAFSLLLLWHSYFMPQPCSQQAIMSTFPWLYKCKTSVWFTHLVPSPPFTLLMPSHPWRLISGMSFTRHNFQSPLSPHLFQLLLSASSPVLLTVPIYTLVRTPIFSYIQLLIKLLLLHCEFFAGRHFVLYLISATSAIPHK